MSVEVSVFKMPGLAIDASTMGSASESHRPTTWPPSDDWPVVIDAKGRVVSRFSDSKWNLSPWAGSALSISFNDEQRIRNVQERIDYGNARLLRTVAAFLLYGPGAVESAGTLKGVVTGLKPLFTLCSQYNISADVLCRYPRVADEVIGRLKASKNAAQIFSRLHRLWLQRDELGFCLLDESWLERMAASLPKRESIQHAYIPPRIWTYQNLRLRECLDDYLEHKASVEACFDFCLEAMILNAGSAEAVFSTFPTYWHPFAHDNRNVNLPGKKFYGRFSRTAKQFGIADLLSKWLGIDEGIKSLSKYLSLISHAGIAYTLNFSLMRSAEAASLRSDCLTVERDSLGQDIYLLKGRTTKTQNDDNACWIVSKSVVVAVEAMRSVAHLRTKAASINPSAELKADELSNPYLLAKAYEPWSAGSKTRGGEVKSIGNYRGFLDRFPRLLDAAHIQINEQDLAIARTINDNLPADEYAEGSVWPFSYHQLRRTGAVNMLSSGLVTEGDLSYQLKHLNRQMSRYYANNHRHLQAVLNETSGRFYTAEAFNRMAKKAKEILSDQHISPHGEKRKGQLLEMIENKNHQDLVRLAKAGKVKYHETFLGGCSNPGAPCSMGGVSNISSCMGYGTATPCEWATVDKSKRPTIVKLIDILQSKIKPEHAESMLNQSLLAQVESATRALEIIDAN